MVKLSSARDGRLYGPWRVRNRWEYINAGLHIFAVVLLACGILAQLSSAGGAKSGLVVILTSLAIFAVVNLHDLAAHMAGVDFRWSVMWLDTQLVFVECAAPLFHSLGSLLTFLTVALLLAQEYRGYEVQLQKHCLRLLVAGPALWVIGAVLDSCQIYETADGHVQILQKGVQIPFLIGSLLFLFGGIFNGREARQLLGKKWVWFGMWGSLLFLVGGVVNLVKVFKMQQSSEVRLEQLRGGAQERLRRAREGQEPLLGEEEPRAVRIVNEGDDKSSTPYKGVLISES